VATKFSGWPSVVCVTVLPKPIAMAAEALAQTVMPTAN
jgi:hypothetical protein